MIKKQFPRVAKLKSFAKLRLKQRWTSNYELLTENKVLLVDCKLTELRNGMKLEGVIRRLDYEGKHGLILYGVAYRPIFREAYAVIVKPKPVALAQLA